MYALLCPIFARCRARTLVSFQKEKTANSPCPKTWAQVIAAELPLPPRRRGRRLQALRPRLAPGLPKIPFSPVRPLLYATPSGRKNVSYQRPTMKLFCHHLGIWPFTGLIIPKSKRPRKCPFGHKMSLAGRKRAHFPLNCGRCIVLAQKIVKIPHPKIRFCTKCLIFSSHFRHGGVILFTKPLRHPCGMPPPLVGEARQRHRPDALAVAAPPFLALLLGELAR